MNLIQTLRQFTIRTRMLGAIVMVLMLLLGVGAAGLLGLSKVEQIGEKFVTQTHADTLTRWRWLSCARPWATCAGTKKTC